MAEKSLFLSDLYTGSLFNHASFYSLRDFGEFRGLSPIFSGADLNVLTQLTLNVARNRLPAGSYRTSSSKGTAGGAVTVPIAARILTETIPNVKITVRTWQNYLDLACDLRLIKRLPQQYVVHPYGRALAYLFKDSESVINNINWKAFFIDRLFYEDGAWIWGILTLCSNSDNSNLNAFELGTLLRKLVMDWVRQKLLEGNSQKWVAKLLQEKVAKKESMRPAEIKAVRKPIEAETERRKELEFVTRRDWLVKLGLIEFINPGYKLTTSGQVFLKNIQNPSDLQLDFFTDKIMGILSSTIKQAPILALKEKQSLLVEDLERTFMNLTHEPMRIIETSILVNTVLFASFPKFYGERWEVFETLRNASESGITKLRLQSAQRINDFYVKIRH